MLTVGLIAEALVFTISAFEKNEDPVALGIQAESEDENSNNKVDTTLLTVLDADVLKNLSANFKNLTTASEALSDSVQINTIIKQYNDQMTTAVSHFNALNTETEKHLKASSTNANINAEIVEKSKDVQEQLSALNSNLKALNQVYQGMLLAMEKK
jgi:predicted glycosyltransferase involved in capsule biosynthesis